MPFGLPDTVDLNDAVLAPIAVAGTAISTEFVQSIQLITGHDLTATAFSLGDGMALSIAGLLAVLAFAIAWITNDRSLDDFRDGRSNGSDPEQYIVMGAPLAVLGVELFPAFSDFVAGSPYIAGTVTLAVSAAFYLVAHR